MKMQYSIRGWFRKTIIEIDFAKVQRDVVSHAFDKCTELNLEFRQRFVDSLERQNTIAKDIGTKIEEYVRSEEFIDRIIKRINRKQLK